MKRGKIIPELSSNYSIVEFPDFSSKEMYICSEDTASGILTFLS